MNRFIILFLSLILLTFKLEASDLHAIIVGDTIYTGFWGHSKGAIDVWRMQQEIHQISIQTGLTLKETILTGEQMTTSNLLEELTNLQVKEDDVILFYYTGDGQRLFNKKNHWPNLTFIDGKSMDFGPIQEFLLHKNPRLLIALAEAANFVVSPDAALPEVKIDLPATKRPVQKVGDRISDGDVYADLFLHTSGWIIASAAEPDSPAPSSEVGGSFTYVFELKLHEAAAKNEKISWQTLFDRIFRSLDDGSRWSSRPIYSIRSAV